jgi:hypothetical protein
MSMSGYVPSYAKKSKMKSPKEEMEEEFLRRQKPSKRDTTSSHGDGSCAVVGIMSFYSRSLSLSIHSYTTSRPFNGD